MARPKSLIWIGPMNDNGEPARWVPGVSARDLSEGEIRRLSEQQLADALASGFYEVPGAKPAKAAPVIPVPVSEGE